MRILSITNRDYAGQSSREPGQLRALSLWAVAAIMRFAVERTEGNIAAIFALALPVVFGGTAIAVDSAHLYRLQGEIQAIADSAALAAAKEIHIFASTNETIAAAGKSRAEAMITDSGLRDEPHTVQVAVDKKAGTVRVDISLRAKAILPVSVYAENPINVFAEARAFGQVNVCVLALNAASPATLNSKDIGVVAAPNCAVQSNSTDPGGLVVATGGTIVSKLTCSAGGVIGLRTSFLPDPPQSDCPAIPDPLSSRAPPTVGGACDYNKFAVKGGTKTIYPGVYCGGLALSNAANVTAAPGTYIIKGGTLAVAQDAILRGDYVSFYFADDAAVFSFKDRSVIELSAPKDGDMAGILFFENRSSKLGRTFAIGSGNVKKLLGTIYLPRGLLAIDAKGDIAAQSAYTVLIANRIDLRAANLVVNTDYGLTDVPVPAGLGSDGRATRLER